MFTLRHTDLSSIRRTQVYCDYLFLSHAWQHIHVVPALGSWKQGDPQGSLTTRPSLLSMLQVSKVNHPHCRTALHLHTQTTDPHRSPPIRHEQTLEEVIHLAICNQVLVSRLRMLFGCFESSRNPLSLSLPPPSLKNVRQSVSRALGAISGKTEE